MNSNAYDKVAPGSKVYYDLSPWNIALISVDCMIGVLALGSVLWMILRELDDKKNPNKFIHEGEE